MPDTTDERLALLHRVMFRHLSEEQFAYFVQRVRELGFSPWSDAAYPQLVADAEGMPVVLIRLKIAAIRVLAFRTKQYAGCDAGQFVYGDDERLPASAHVTVYRMVDGQREAFTGVAHWADYAPLDIRGTLWDRMPHHCLELKAEAIALRKAFPEFLSGTHEPDIAGETNGGRRRPQATASAATDPADCPETPMTFALRLADYGIRGPDQPAVVAKLRQLLPTRDGATFYRHALSLIRGNPSAWGASRPADNVG